MFHPSCRHLVRLGMTRMRAYQQIRALHDSAPLARGAIA